VEEAVEEAAEEAAEVLVLSLLPVRQLRHSSLFIISL
jgi:hypothetical protein